MAHVMIDGRPLECGEGTTILEAARAVGIEVPTLCHDERIAPTGSCRLCLVDVKGSSKPLAACTTPVLDGMEIETHTPAIEQVRRTLLTMLARHYPADAKPVSDSASIHAGHSGHEFDRLLDAYDIRAQGPGASTPADVDTSHPYIHVDMSRCVNCFRCVRICDELQGQGVWHIRNRGVGTELHPSGDTLATSPCVSCGACVDTCPTGALEDKRVLALLSPMAWTRTVCPYCGVGCELEVGTRDGQIITARPAHHAVVNRGHACVKGRYAFEFVHAHDRVTTPLLREEGHWRESTWPEVVHETARRLRETIARYGPMRWACSDRRARRTKRRISRRSSRDW
jgi:formate dehydrogenase major subunit